MKKMCISLLCTLVLGFLYYYFLLPPINLSSIAFWIFIFFLLIIFITIDVMLHSNEKNFESKLDLVLLALIPSILCIILVVNFVNCPLFNSKSYANRITIQEDGVFKEDVSLVNFDTTPLLDKDSSQKLGDRVMGQMPELVSQFSVSELYTQINYNNKIVRVTPLEYNGFFKYLANRKEGVKGYIMVDSTTGDAKLTKLEKGMKYMPSAILSQDLHRHLRFSYPTFIFGKENFEIDNEGNPFWIVPTMKYTAFGMKKEVNGVVILDPITGDSNYYAIKEIPAWVDHVYEPSLIIEQVNNWGQYKGGFINSMFGQKNVVATTEGYNYLTIDDDVYLYTGITSVASDESNLGFILSNLRTKETTFYSVPGAEEFSAMASAEGQVQQMNYTATFPLLINLNDRPTYLISLKDNAGLVKMYAFVDVTNYQKVVVTDAAKGIKEAASNYLEGEKDFSNLSEKTITITQIQEGIKNGNTYYYIEDEEKSRYRVNIQVDDSILPFIKVGDTIKIRFKKEENMMEILSLESID